MTQEKYLFEGQCAITKTEELRAGLDTCLGVVIHDIENRMYGLGHAVVPSEYGLFYLKSREFHDFFVTPKKAIEKIVIDMMREGSNITDLRAYLFGCYPDDLEFEEK